MKNILVLCIDNASRSQMAEAYLRFFTREKVNVFSAGMVPAKVHSAARQEMLEDNIDISEQETKPIEEFAGLHFDYLITVCQEAAGAIPVTITAEVFHHYDIPNPATADGNPEAFAEARELVKKEMLRFIGKNVELSSDAPVDVVSV